MAKRKPDEVVEFRISLQDKEREMFDSLLTAYTLGNVSKLLEGLGIPELAKMMDDPTKMIQVLYSVAVILEALGLETGLPTPVDLAAWYNERQEKLQKMAAQREAEGGDVSVIGQILDTFRTVFGVDPSKRWES